MVGVTHPRSTNRYPWVRGYFVVGLVGLTVTLCGFWFVEDPVDYTSSISGSRTHLTAPEEAALRHERLHRIKRPPMVRAIFDEDFWGDTKRQDDKLEDDRRVPCNYQSIDDFTPEERLPVEGFRHMITPPQGGKLSVRSSLGKIVPFLVFFLGGGAFVQMMILETQKS
jgi:hypothetical protein